MNCIDINCDVGESFGRYELGSDQAIMPYISSANIACGFHAGDPSIMRKTVQWALADQVAIGAHPGLPDLIGFGRRNMAISAQEAFDMVVYQIGALYGVVAAAGGQLHHVKPHGALYNMAALDAELAEAIAKAVYQVDPELILYGLSNSNLTAAGQKLGLKIAHEVFADRTYQSDGTLTSRSQKNCLITDAQAAVDQVIRIIIEQQVSTQQGIDIAINADTVCIHGDTAQALIFAKQLHETVLAHGIEIKTVV